MDIVFKMIVNMKELNNELYKDYNDLEKNEVLNELQKIDFEFECLKDLLDNYYMYYSIDELLVFKDNAILPELDIEDDEYIYFIKDLNYDLAVFFNGRIINLFNYAVDKGIENRSN